MEIEDPDELLWTPIPFITQELEIPLYDWGDDVVSHFEDSREYRKVALCAPNGSGKSSHIVTGLALWWLAIHPLGKVVITTKDGKQLVNQVWAAFERKKNKFPTWKFLRGERKIENGTGGFIVGFTTNDPGNAEGWHKDKLNELDGPLLIIIDEAKSVKENIFVAVDRCTKNKLLLISSPGLKMGRFYRAMTDVKLGFRTIKVGLTDCPHIPQERIDDVINQYGADHPFTRSTLYGEFMDMDDDTQFIVPPSKYQECLENPPVFTPSNTGDWIAFCDFAAGGAENVLALRNGNKITIEMAKRESNTMAGVGDFIRHFIRLGLQPSQIYGDNNGLGKVMIDRMYELGWPINRVDGENQNARNEAYYTNRGAEIWFTGSAQIQNCEVILPEDEVLQAQMTTRKVVGDSAGRLGWQTKKKMKEDDGLPSPDRADAVMGVLSHDVALANILLESGGLRRLESMARTTKPENAALEESGSGVAYNSVSANPWMQVWERPVYGLSYIAVLNPMAQGDATHNHVFYIVRNTYLDEKSKTQKRIRLACRIKLPCQIDGGPLIDMISRVLNWYGNPLLVPIAGERGDIIEALRHAGVGISKRRDFENTKRGAKSNTIKYGWESTKFTQSLWISALAEAIREETMDIEDEKLVSELVQISSDNADSMREAEALGVALRSLTYATVNTPHRTIVPSSDDPMRFFRAPTRKSAATHGIG